MDMMKDALARRKGKSLDISILVDGQPLIDAQGGPADPKGDLAPPQDPATPGDEGASPMLAAGPEGSPQEEAAESPEQEMQEVMMGGMSPADQASLAAKKPTSLGDRVRQMAMSRKPE